MREITIAGRKLGDGHPPFIVAEVGVNHDGSVRQALKMVDEAAACGVHAVKFGVFKADEFCAKSDSLYETFKRCELPDDAWYEIRARCDAAGVVFFGTPQNESDLEILLKVGVPCIKVGSDDLTNLALIRAYAKHRLPLILSIGMADAWDVLASVAACGETPLIVCACTSEYPCPPEHANLARIATLGKICPDIPIGFSDHTIGAGAATIAAALSACYIEKHFTLDVFIHGPDHAWSATPERLQTWAEAIRTTHAMLGSGEIEPTESERENRDKWRRKSGQRIRGSA